MKVSFTGIENISVYKDSNPKVVNYRLNDGARQTAVADYYGVKVDCNLTDDEYGTHLKDMYDVFRKTANYYGSSDPTRLIFTVEHFDIHLPSGQIIPKDNIKFNAYPIDLISPNDKKLLAFYSFMAKITREIIGMSDNKDMNKILQNTNNTISKNAEHFIDEIM